MIPKMKSFIEIFGNALSGIENHSRFCFTNVRGGGGTFALVLIISFKKYTVQ